MQNPYQYKKPVVEADNFFGRQNIVSKIYSRIGASRPQSVSIVGDFKVGKSSLMCFLANEHTKKSFLGNQEEFIYLNLPIGEKEATSLDSFNHFLLNKLKTDLNIDSNVDTKTALPVYDYIKKLVEQLNKQGKKIILFFDDFNFITQNKAFPLEFFSFLRSLANNFNLAYVTTSHHDLQKLCVSKDVEESPFFNIFTNMTLKGLEETEVENLILQPTTGHDIDLAKETKLIAKYAGPFPYPLQVACHLLFDLKSNDATKQSWNKSDFEQVFYQQVTEYFQRLWLNFSEEHREIFRTISSSVKVKENQNYLVNDLIKRNYLLKTNGRPRLFSPVFQKYISDFHLGANHRKQSGNIFIRLVQRLFSSVN